jgi:F0F1-type ATP synthase assembly protein I
MENEAGKTNKKFKSFAFATSIYGSASIFGPMLFLGGVGYFLDKNFLTGHIFLIIGLALAFITTNILLFRKAIELTKEIEKLAPKPLEEDEDDFKDF